MIQVLVAIQDSTPDPTLTLAGHSLGALPGEEVRATILAVVERERDQAEANDLLESARQYLGWPAPSIETKLRIGHPVEEMVQEAREGQYDLLLVGENQQRRPITRPWLGTTEVWVVEHVPCSTLVARGRIGPIRRALFCDSGADNPSAVSLLTAQLAGLLRGKEVTVLHVMSQISAAPGIRGVQLRAGAEELMAATSPEGALLRRDVRVLQELGLDVRPAVRHGLVVDEILAEAQDGDHDLVIIGAHRERGWAHLLLDDIAHKIVAHLDRPVLVLR